MRRVLAWEECAKKEIERARRHSVEDDEPALDQDEASEIPKRIQLPRSGRSKWFNLGGRTGGWNAGGWGRFGNRNNGNTGGNWG